LKDIWVSVSGAIAQQKNVDTIANNVANINTPGFKKDSQIFKEHLTALSKGNPNALPNKEWAPGDFYKTYGAEQAYVKSDGTYTNFAQGKMIPTGNSLDLALRGKGFFEVDSPNGVRYSRNGSLSISGQGILVNSNGFPILAKSDGETNVKERYIKIPPGKTFINLQGEIFTNNVKVKNLSVVEFKELQKLNKEGDSLFVNTAKDNINEQEPTTAVYQGYSETSNVNALQEMSDLIKASRQFETIQRVIKTYDSIAGKAVNEIAKF